jgi:hypothetical protein
MPAAKGETAMNWNETFCSLDAGLPEDIARLKAAGYYRKAIALIDRRLGESWTDNRNGASRAYQPESDPMPAMPDAQRACLTVQREMMRRIAADYPYTEAQAVRRVQEHIPNFTAQEFRNMVDADRIDWRFIEGEKYYFRRFYQSLVYTDAAFAARTGLAPKESAYAARLAAAEAMRKNGSETARITFKFTIRASDEAFASAKMRAAIAGRDTVKAKIWLPIPAACAAQPQIEALEFSEQPNQIAPEDALQRTVYWEKALGENRGFTAEYRYTEKAVYSDPMSAPKVLCEEDRNAPSPEDCLGEQAPHIVFTPYLRALTAQLTQGAADEAEKAKRIFDFITLHVQYRYMPSYFTLEAIPDACVRSCRGDCGVQALTFITMCRIAGIPAVWQSGLMAGPKKVGGHDWAMFYLAGHGWMYADCSFGGSAARMGDETLRRHYFGNLDPYRMTANRAFGAALTPPKESWRNDPYDNQMGEMELEGVGLTGEEYDTEIELVNLEMLD